MNLLNLALVFTSTVLLILSFTIPFLGFCIWFAFVPFLLVIEKHPPFKNSLIGLPVGAAFFAAFLFWIVFYEWRIFVIVIALTLPFFPLFSWLTSRLGQSSENQITRTLAPPLAWSTVTFLYSFTPIGIIGDQIAFVQAPLFPALVRLTGVSGVAFLILLMNSLIARWIATKQTLFRSGMAVTMLVLLLGTLPSLEARTSEPIKVALVQHNFPMSTEWRMSHQKEILNLYEKAILDQGRAVNLIVFPQYGLPIDVLREPEWLEKLSGRTHTAILLATYIPKLAGGSLTEGPRTDSGLLFTPSQAVQEYQALTPPPFRNIGQVMGSVRKPLLLDGSKVGVMLCYEDAKSAEGRLWVKSGAEILAALSNPGHFMGTPLPRYHLTQDQIRAIETGRYVIRVSPNGFSAVIDPNGRIVTKSKLNEEAVLKSSVYPSRQQTVFALIGPVVPIASTLLSLILLLNGSYVRDSIRRLARKKR